MRKVSISINELISDEEVIIHLLKEIMLALIKETEYHLFFYTDLLIISGEKCIM